MERPETISLKPCTKRRGQQAAFLCSIEMPSFLCMISMHTMQNIETLFDKCPRCRLAKCQASSGWSAGEAVGSAETILTSAPPAQSSCRRTNFMMLDIPSTGAEGACQIGFRDMEGLCHLGGSGTPRPRLRVRDAFRGFLPRNLGAEPCLVWGVSAL